jgi:predicted enzyme related to lactoylglutathione lyase
MSKLLGLRTTIYRVPDIEAAKTWYSRVFEIPPYFDEPFYVGFNIAGYELGLMPEDGFTAKAENVLTYWGVDDIHGEYNRFLDAGATSLGEPVAVGGEIVTAELKDPWGNVIGLIYNPDFAH